MVAQASRLCRRRPEPTSIKVPLNATRYESQAAGFSLRFLLVPKRKPWERKFPAKLCFVTFDVKANSALEIFLRPMLKLYLNMNRDFLWLL